MGENIEVEKENKKKEDDKMYELIISLVNFMGDVDKKNKNLIK